MEKQKEIIPLLTFLFLFLGSSIFAQAPQQSIISGTVLEASTGIPLEYASIYAENEKNPNIISGGMTDAKGHFSFEVLSGSYFIKIDFLGYKTLELKNVVVNGNTNIGTQKVTDDSQMLEEVTVIAERSTVEVKLDKKIYNVGEDMIVKGGTAGDVLDNVPSVTVDSEGAVSLRGNENVKVLIDGKPTGLANNIQEAMKILAAESIDKVEVITNPSARYEAEGGAGIINIILKKGKGQGLNGSITGTIGNPRNYEFNANVNYRSDNFNFFTTLGYQDSKSKGYGVNENEYFDKNGNTTQYINEYKNNNREREGYNGTFGLEWYLTPSVTWTNTLTARRNNIQMPNTVSYEYLNDNNSFLYNRYRYENKKANRNDIEYTTTIEKQFAKEDHKLIVEASISQDKDKENSAIEDIAQALNKNSFEKSTNNEKERAGLVKVDYVLPIGQSGQLEAGYLGTFKSKTTDFQLFNQIDNVWENNTKLSNTLEYKEKINALYLQYGNKITRNLSFLAGVRWEDSNIDVNQLINQDFNNKKYNDFFPSVFLNYEFDDASNVTASYSRRINRPRGFFLNPFSNYTSDINFFQGNPDLDPSKTHAFDLGYLKKWTGITANASVYYNKTDDSFQFVRRIGGTSSNGTPIIVSSPINLATEYRYGVDITLNYTPFKWWRLNGNFNFFRSETRGDYTFVDFDGNKETQNFDNNAYAWFSRLSSKITLPYKIDWQMNGMYRAPQTTAQGEIKGNLSANLSLSKDILKDKATITFNINDLFDSRKRESDTYLPQSYSHSEMQWRGRQVNLSFTYRFNQPKNVKLQRGMNSGDSGMDNAEIM
ncbi:outer membrane beta-barrel family protein [Myroides indicus]|uniref:Outer membrane receptor protein involved in Fe transport n=1 Tax=Myroides indicus TaxID=1323422 RepID=A0A4R7ER08_9FLAO|nr:outer membrane beta-barrel family protein [Myroides indicus]TDS55326.1 outer membrane receptor protein involved in Fe transport [Myroides indicus]